MFFIYYLICVFYCFYHLLKRYRTSYSGTHVWETPALDTIMIITLAWLLAPIDFSLTWIRLYKEAEEVRRNKSKVL